MQLMLYNEFVIVITHFVTTADKHANAQAP